MKRMIKLKNYSTTFLFLICSCIILLAQPKKEEEYNPDDILLEYYDSTNSLDYMDYINENLGKENGFVAIQRMTEPLLREKKWDEAIKIYSDYKKSFPTMTARFDKIIKILKAPMENLEEINLGSGVNSIGSEYSPLPTADDKTLYFTGKSRNGLNQSEDIFYAKNVDGIWQKAKKLEEPVNSDDGEAPQSISTDGNQLIIFGQFKENLGGGDLYYTDRTPNGWSEVQHYPAPLNSKYFDCDAKLTNDGKAIIFVSDRPGGIGEFHPYQEPYHGSLHGNTDIYVCTKTENGWSEPINLGKMINTPFAERKPFLHMDGKSLYFSSEGHDGLGKLDIYKSTKLKEDSWTEWSEPINLGKEVNSGTDERGSIVNTFGDLAYFATAERNLNFGKSDIYRMVMPENLRPDPVVTVSGIVVDNQGKTLDADIVWEDLDSRKEIGKMKTNPASGEYFIVLPTGKNYGIFAKKDGYFPISKSYDLVKEKKSYAITDTITMFLISDLIGDDLELTGQSDLSYDAFDFKNSKKITMNNLFFETGKWNLLPSSFLELDRIVYLLNNYPIEQVEISGHTDSVGNVDNNILLSDKRAKSVGDYLLKKGIPQAKFVTKGYGMQYPVAANDTDENKKKNRRVELRIIKVAKKQDSQK